jgi:predicted nucleic acid-binding protein
MEKVFVDTSAFVALFVKNDNNHHHAQKTYDTLRDNKIPFITSDYIMDETITNLWRRGSKELSIAKGEVFFTSALCTMMFVCPEYLEPAWGLYKKYKDKKCSFTDATSFAIMKGLNINKVFTFDEDFAQAGFEIVR